MCLGVFADIFLKSVTQMLWKLKATGWKTEQLCAAFKIPALLTLLLTFLLLQQILILSILISTRLHMGVK